MRHGERQVSPTRAGIRRDHVARYEWASTVLPTGSYVVDAGCGVGYGSQLMAELGHHVVAFDIDREAIAYARRHYSHENVEYLQGDAASIDPPFAPTAVVAFEIIEHLEDPRSLLRAAREFGAATLLASVPNELVFPHRGEIAFHHRHYTPTQFKALLNECGWSVKEWYGQEGPESPPEENLTLGRTVIAVCEPLVVEAGEPKSASVVKKKLKTVAILGLGPSLEQYVDLAKRLGNRRKLCDETWGINAVGSVIHCDLVFHMDDVRVQMARAEATPESNIAAMVEWLRTYQGQVLTSHEHEDFPCLRAFPLETVINACDGYAYFNSTAAYAVAFAIHRKFERIMLFGCDFTYANSEHAEKGRACVEFWLGFAAARGIQLSFPKTTSLLDAYRPMDERLYGYDGYHVDMEKVEGVTRVMCTPRESLPTAEEIEDRYDHSRHPNEIVEAQREGV